MLYYFYVIEFQKRGLPHCHLLVSLKEEDKPGNDVELIDKIVSTKLNVEDEDLKKKLKHMTHGRCVKFNANAPCMKDGVCSRGFPKPLKKETTISPNGYPQYARRNEEDRWCIPYNPYLIKRYDCHINVEVCSGIRAIKYLHKYVTKGVDNIQAGFMNRKNEINRFLNYRYVTAPEAFWKIFHYKIHDRSHSIINLTVHLEG